MSCTYTFRTAFTSILRHNASFGAPRLIAPATRSFQTSRPASDTPASSITDFGAILSKSKPVSRATMDDDEVVSQFDQFLHPSAFSSGEPLGEMHHLHIYSTKHNTHITFTDPNKNPIISVSAGNLGFKKSQRGTYDAAYQLASHVFAQLEMKGVRPKELEVVLRDFGEGREAAVKALLGTEGRNLKGVIKRVTDATRLKFGGTRSKAPRRLG